MIVMHKIYSGDTVFVSQTGAYSKKGSGNKSLKYRFIVKHLI